MTTPSEAHTPLPWDYFVGNGAGRGLIRIETGAYAPTPGVHIASMVRGNTSEANAALIVAAVNERPKLLERLRKMEGALRKARVAIATWSPDPTEPLDEIDAALTE